MSNEKISFQVLPPPKFLGSDYFSEGEKKYFLFQIVLKRKLSKEQTFCFFNETLCPLLMISSDTASDLVDQFKNAKDDIFTTSLANLKFKPNRLTRDDTTLNVLEIKDASQVQKSTEISFPEFTFKVIKRSEFEKIEGYKSENKILKLDIEPLDLGIEGIPKITRIKFYFFTPDPPHIQHPVDYDTQLNREEYETLFRHAEGKDFVIKIRKFTFDDQEAAKIGQPLVCDALKFSLEGDIEEIKEKISKSFSEIVNKAESDDKSSQSILSEQKLENQKTILIIGGVVIAILGLICLVYYWKKQNEEKK